MSWVLQQMCLYLMFAFRAWFIVAGMLFLNATEHESLSSTHWTFRFQTDTITNGTKCCQIHTLLFRIKLNTVLALVTKYFTLQEAA